MKRQYLTSYRMQAGERKKIKLDNEDLLGMDDTRGQPIFLEVLELDILCSSKTPC